MRVFSILDTKKDGIDIMTDIVSHLPAIDSRICIFDYNDDLVNTLDGYDIVHVRLPDEVDSISKQKNYIIKYVKENQKDAEFMHLIEDTTVILKNPCVFLNDIETMMQVFDQKDWFNTICDGMNYVYSKYNPRVQISIDKTEYMLLGIPEILFTSHANMQWMAFDMTKIDDTYQYFCEEFSVPMFVIIEHLANRRNTSKGKLSISFMNMYPTVSSEVGIFRQKQLDAKDGYSAETMQKEDQLFKSKGIDYMPTNSIDDVLKNVYDILKMKMEEK